LINLLNYNYFYGIQCSIVTIILDPLKEISCVIVLFNRNAWFKFGHFRDSKTEKCHRIKVVFHDIFIQISLLEYKSITYDCRLADVVVRDQISTHPDGITVNLQYI